MISNQNLVPNQIRKDNTDEVQWSLTHPLKSCQDARVWHPPWSSAQYDQYLHEWSQFDALEEWRQQQKSDQTHWWSDLHRNRRFEKKLKMHKWDSINAKHHSLHLILSSLDALLEIIDRHVTYSWKLIWSSSLESKTRKILSNKAESLNNIADWNCLQTQIKTFQIELKSYFLLMNSWEELIVLKWNHKARISSPVNTVALM